MKSKTRRQSVILPVALIVLSICIILGTTLAYFVDTRPNNSPVNFGKIEISVDDTFKTTVPLTDALPGDKITDKVSFSKSVDSESMYVRVKALFETSSTEDGVQDLVDELNTYSLDLANGANYSWNTEYQNHYYLVTSADANVLYNVQQTEEITFSNALYIPRELKQLPSYAQYMESVNLNLEHHLQYLMFQTML